MPRCSHVKYRKLNISYSLVDSHPTYETQILGPCPSWIQGFPQEDSIGERIAKGERKRLDLTGLHRKPIKFMTPNLL